MLSAQITLISALGQISKLHRKLYLPHTINLDGTFLKQAHLFDKDGGMVKTEKHWLRQVQLKQAFGLLYLELSLQFWFKNKLIVANM